MINEFKSIADCLDEIEDLIEIFHKDIFHPGGTEALRVVLGENASIESLEYMDDNKIKDSWGLKTSNQDQFPSIKLTVPLRPEGNKFYSSYFAYKNSKKADTKSKEEFENYCKAEGVDFNKFIKLKESEIIKFILQKYTWPNDTRIIEWPKSAYRGSILSRCDSLRKSQDKQVQIVAELYRRYSTFPDDGSRLLIELDKKIENILMKGTEIPTDLLLNILFGKEKRKPNGELKETSRPVLFLDYKPEKDIDAFVFTPERRRHIAEFLKKDLPAECKKGFSYLSGTEVVLIDDKYPEANLGKGKSVSKIILFSKFDANGGQTTVRRYDKSGTAAYRLGVDESARLLGALQTLTKDEYKHKTWDSIPSEKRKSNDLLLAFCKNANIALTPLIMGSSIDDIDDYLNLTQDVADAFKKVKDITLNENVDFIVIRKINDGNQKVIYSTTKSIAKLQRARSEWLSACQNVPEFKMRIKIGQKEDYVKPWPIAPVSLVRLTGLQYKKDMSNPNQVPAISFSDMMDLFFDSPKLQQLALHAINALVNQTEPLFSHCALSKLHAYLNNPHIKIDHKKNNEVLKTATLFAVLLYKIKRNREIYMNDFAFQLGQLCSAMDELHIGYCQDIRKGQIPNVLIGNMSYGIALQSPVAALSVLASRIKPYEAWARKKWVQGNMPNDKAIKNGMYSYKWIAVQSQKINEHIKDNPHLVNDSYKAELMLGYLAGRPFEQAGKIDMKGEV